MFAYKKYFNHKLLLSPYVNKIIYVFFSVLHHHLCLWERIWRLPISWYVFYFGFITLVALYVNFCDNKGMHFVAFITACQRSCWKVMFSLVCVYLSTGSHYPWCIGSPGPALLQIWDLTVQPPPSRQGTSQYMALRWTWNLTVQAPSLPNYWWHLVVITADRFKLIHLRTPLPSVLMSGSGYCGVYSWCKWTVCILLVYFLVSLHIRSMWETICDAQAGFWLNSKFLSKFSRKPLSGISGQKAPPHFRKLQMWNDQSLLWNTPPILENFRFEMKKVYSGIPPPFRKTSDLKWPKFTPKYPPFQKTSDLKWPKFTPKYPPTPPS